MKNKQILNNIVVNSKVFAKNNAEFLLTIGATVGLGLTMVTTSTATIKAVEIYNEIEVDKKRKPTKNEVFLNTLPVYIKPFIFGMSTLLCVHGLNYISIRKQASLISAYQLINSTFNEYKDKVKETYGENAHQKLLDQIYIEHADKTSISAQNIAGDDILVRDDGEPKRFYEPFGDRFFECSMEQVLQAEYHLNRNFSIGGEVSLNDFYEFLGLAPTEDGNLYRWSIEEGYIWIDFNNRKVELDDGGYFYAIEPTFGPEVYE